MGPQYACQSISHLFYDNTLSQSPHHARHPYHEERQQEEDGGVAEGVFHAVVEELHPRFGLEEFLGNIQRPIRKTENEAREQKDTSEDIHLCSDGNGIVANFRCDIKHATPTGLCGTSWEPHRATGREPLTGFMGMTEHARHHPRRGSISVGIRVGAPAEPR